MSHRAASAGDGPNRSKRITSVGNGPACQAREHSSILTPCILCTCALTPRAYCAHPHYLLRSPNRAPSALALLSARCTRCRLLRIRSMSLPLTAIRQRQHGRRARADGENSLLAFSRQHAQSHRVRSPHPPPRTDRPHVSLAVALMRRMPLPVEPTQQHTHAHSLSAAVSMSLLPALSLCLSLSLLHLSARPPCCTESRDATLADGPNSSNQQGTIPKLGLSRSRC